MFTKYTWSKMSVALSICPRIKSISLSINSLYSLRLQLICCSSSFRICKQNKHLYFAFYIDTLWSLAIWDTSFDVTSSRSWNIIILRSLALIRHSVRSLSVGLINQTQTRRNSWVFFYTYPSIIVLLYISIVYNIQNFVFDFTVPQTWLENQAVWSPGLS